MFELAELGHEISKSSYKKQLPALRKLLLDAQLKLATSKKFQVIILIGGVDGSGRGQTVRLLNEWMDARYIETNASYDTIEDDRIHPDMWKYWNTLPPKGKIGIFFGSWYTEPITRRLYKKINNTDFIESLDNIIRFETMLVDEGILVLKFWLHLSKKTQKARLKKMKSNVKKSWQMSKLEREHFKIYDKNIAITEQALMRTNTSDAPWHIIDAANPYYRYVTIGKIIVSALKEKLAKKRNQQKQIISIAMKSIDSKAYLGSFQYNQHMSKTEYKVKLLKLQKELRMLVDKIKKLGKSITIVFEGVDAAGKGGSIRRIVSALDPREYRIVPIAASNEEEKRYPYLWRFWKHIPRQGNLTLFDRSWYGRVLVERIEKFCSESDWMRAYNEINDFEQQLTNGDNILLKFWLTISKEEQLRRFKHREETPHKKYKITEEDWRNRKKWNEYEAAVDEMIQKTSTVFAPWIIIESNDKNYAHIKILEVLIKYMKSKVKKLKKKNK